MTFADEIAAQQRLLLDADSGHAQTVTRWAGGDPNQTTDVSALFTPDGDPDAERNQHGNRVLHFATLDVSDAVTVLESDVWVVAGDCWQTDALEDPLAGMRTIHVKRTVKQTTRRSRQVS